MGYCRDRCYLYKPTVKKILSVYENAKRCQSCEQMIMWEGRYCPCCRTKLRRKARDHTHMLFIRH